jgi:hypothetical protein
MELSPFWEAASCAAIQEFPNILWNPKLHYWSLSWSRSIQSIPPHPISPRSILTLSSHLRLGLPSGLLPSGFPTKVLYAFIFPHSCYMPHLSHPLWLGEQYKLWSSSLCSFLQPPITSFPFGLNILISTLFSNNLSLCSSLNVRDQVSQPYRTTGKILVLCGHGSMMYDELNK